MTSLSTSTASATGNPRNKTALKPGRSLMDWVRLTNSGADLAGCGGKLREISLEELARHNKRNDAWLVIRGNVYNVTSYMEFHPGGEAELIRGIGIDATDLFDEVHRWVNYESMLKKCLVGRLAKTHEIPPPVRRIPISQQLPAPLPIGQPLKINQPIITHDWIQTANQITLVLYTRRKDLTEDCLVTSPVTSSMTSSFDTFLTIDQSTKYEISIKFQNPVQDDNRSCKIHKNSGKIELSFHKLEKDKVWNSIGQVEIKKADDSFRTARIALKKTINHNVRMLTLEKPIGYPAVPVGWHLRLKLRDCDIVRSYTPVLENFTEPEEEDFLYLLVKVYENGKLTSRLDALEVNSEIEISEPTGTFHEERVDNFDSVITLAAGSGITPMIRVIDKFLKMNKSANLLFFNKQQRDIIWKDEFRDLAESSNNRFQVTHVLSVPDPEWTGPTGRFSDSLLKEHVGNCNEKSLVCVCGPTDFTIESLRILKDLGFPDDHVHAFIG